MSASKVRVEGVFDDIRVEDVRALEALAEEGRVHVLLTPDRALDEAPRLAEAERKYFLEALRWVARVSLAGTEDVETSAALAAGGPDEPAPPEAPQPGHRVLVSGCYDWLHTGHVRFFEEAASLGQLHVTVGSDRSVRRFKGPGHPLQPEDERAYMVGSVRHVHRAVVASGDGWLDWAPEAERLAPDLFVVNEDGDRPEKRAFCAEHGIEYRVLRRTPKLGLPVRSSTELRGF